MTIFENETEQQMSREEAAALLRELADTLASNNSVDVDVDGRRITVSVPDRVTVEVEVEIGAEESSLEIELTW